MEDLMVLKNNKEYDHQETKSLLAKVRDFFQTKLRIIVPECVTEKEEQTDQINNGFIEAFFIEEGADAIFSACNGFDDLEGILDLFESRLNELLDGMDALLDKNADLDDESKKSLESYASAIDKCINVYVIQRRKRMAKFKELNSVAEIRDELRQLFTEIVANYIIAVLFDALYERIKNNSGTVYEMVVREVNEFLSQNGIYTKRVNAGDAIDPEYMEPTNDSSENYTDDYQKFDKIDEIRRYPYMFKGGYKIVDGYARIWRRKD